MTIADKLLYRQGTCPWWVCFTFDNPLRRLLQDPDKMLQGLVKAGETVYDIGCGMGYFSIPLARLVGEGGKVICVDLQKEMLAAARRRAERAGLVDRMQIRQCTTASLGLEETADFALAFWMVHEVPDKESFLREIKNALKPGASLFIVEPKIHVTRDTFDATVATALSAGFTNPQPLKVLISRAVLLRV